MIKAQLVELSMSRTDIKGHKYVRAVDVRLYTILWNHFDDNCFSFAPLGLNVSPNSSIKQKYNKPIGSKKTPSGTPPSLSG